MQRVDPDGEELALAREGRWGGGGAGLAEETRVVDLLGKTEGWGTGSRFRRQHPTISRTGERNVL